MVVDTISTLGKSLWLPSEQLIGGTLTGDRLAVKDALKTLSGLLQFQGDAWRTLKVALKDEANAFDRQYLTNELPRHAITSSYLGVHGGPLAQTVDAIGAFVRLPSRLRTSQDSYFKVLNFRAYANSELTRMAMEQGARSADEVADFVAKGFKYLEDPAARAASTQYGDLFDRALGYARDSVFQSPLTGIAGDFQRVLSHNPALRLFLPFYRTPVNLVKDVLMRTPGLQQLQRGWWQDILAGGARRANAVGKLATGSLLWSTAVGLAAGGYLTGAGPRDADKRTLKRASGWQPYSFILPGTDGRNTYVQFNRLDPMAMVFGIAADAWDISRANPRADLDVLASAGAFAATRTIENRTMLKGVSDLINALQDERTTFRFGQQFIAGFVPSAFNTIPDDDYVRETRGLFDAALAKTPGLSQTLPLKYNALGKPVTNSDQENLNFINPFKITESKNDPVINEMVKLDTKFSPPQAVYGVDWRGFEDSHGVSAYDHLLQEYGTVKIDGKTLSDALAGLVKSSSYRALPEAAPGVEPTGRIAEIRSLMLKYQDVARRNVQRKFPQLQQSMDRHRKVQLQGKVRQTLNALSSPPKR
jgi:hypothetical protein